MSTGDDDRLIDVITAVGSSLVNAIEYAAMNEQVSSLDVVRRESFINRKSILEARPNVLVSDSLEPPTFLIHDRDSSTHEDFRQWSPDLQYQQLEHFGGCLMDFKHGTSVVHVLFSKSQQNLILYVPEVCLDSLQIDYNDEAFEESDASWEDYVVPSTASDLKTLRKKYAVWNKECGPEKLPDFMFTGHYHVLRYGVIPFLSLRSPRNEHEVDLIYKATQNIKHVVPSSTCSLLDLIQDMKVVCLASFFDSGNAFKISKAQVPECDKHSEMHSSVMTALAMIILQKADDPAVDSNGERISENTISIPESVENNNLLRKEAANEKSRWMAAKARPVTALQASTDSPLNLSELMKSTKRHYTTRLIADTESLSTKQAVETVLSSLLSKSDAQALSMEFVKHVLPSSTIVSVLMNLKDYLEKDNALTVVTREADGRFSEMSMISSCKVTRKLSRGGLLRSAVSPWAHVVIVERSRIYQLHVVEPDFIDRGIGTTTKNNALTIRASSTFRNDVSSTDIQELKSEMTDMRKLCLQIQESTDEIKKKMESQPCLPSSTGFKEDTHQTPDKTVLSLKRTLEVLENYEKRLKQSPNHRASP